MTSTEGAADQPNPRGAAFYALTPGGWRDYVTLLHPPYTLWHLAYVAMGAGLAPEVKPLRLAAALAAFALAVGVGAHALDELRGHPLRTQIRDGVLWALAVASVAAAAAIGVVSALAWSLWLLPLVAAGAFVVFAYNLELFGGRFHTDLWFALSWGSLPLLAGYLVTAERLAASALAGAAAAGLLCLAQRTLSTRVRTIRRQAQTVDGSVAFADGSREELTPSSLTAVPERALKLLAAAHVTLAAALVLAGV